MAICQTCQIPTKGHVSCHWQEHSWSSQCYWAPWRSQIWFGRCHWVECRASLAPHIFSNSSENLVGWGTWLLKTSSQPPLRPGRFDERRYSSLAPEASPWAPPVTTLMEIDCYLATPSLSSELTTSHILPSLSPQSVITQMVSDGIAFSHPFPVIRANHILPSVSHRSDGRLPPILFNLPCHHFSAAFTFSHLFPVIIFDHQRLFPTLLMSHSLSFP